MPKKGDLLNLKVERILKNGALLSNNDDSNDYFLHISEISDKWIESIEDYIEKGQEVQCRVIFIKNQKNKKTFNVSLKMADEDTYQAAQFDKKLKKFLKTSSEKQSQIKQNKERKRNNGKRKNKYNR